MVNMKVGGQLLTMMVDTGIENQCYDTCGPTLET